MKKHRLGNKLKSFSKASITEVGNDQGTKWMYSIIRAKSETYFRVTEISSKSCRYKKILLNKKKKIRLVKD